MISAIVGTALGGMLTLGCAMAFTHLKKYGEEQKIVAVKGKNMSRKIHVAIKPVGKKGYFADISSEELKKLIGGDIETIRLTSDLAFLCQMYDAFDNSDFNIEYCHYSFFGTVVICGMNGDSFADLPFDDEIIKMLFLRIFKEERI